MKRTQTTKWNYVFIVIFAMIVCAGCREKITDSGTNIQTEQSIQQDQDTQQEPNTQQESNTQQEPNAQQEQDTSTEPDKQQEQDTSTEPDRQKESALPFEDTILGNRKLWGNNTALYKLDAPFLEGITYSNMYPYQDNLLFIYNLYDEIRKESYTYLRLVSFETGEIISETRLESLLEIKIQEINGNLVVHDSAYGKAWVFNESLEILETYQFEGNVAYFDASGEHIYQFFPNEGIKTRNLKSGVEKTILSDAIHLFTYGEMNQIVTITYTDRNTRKKVSAFVDLRDASVTVLDTPKALNTVYYGSGIWHGMVCDEEYYYLFGNAKNPDVFKTEIGNTTFLYPETSQLMVLSCDDKNILRGFIYDKDGTLISSCELKGIVDFLFEPPVWYEAYQGYIFPMMNENDTAEFFFWDISKKMQGENLKLLPMKHLLETPDGSAVFEECYARAKEIGETYSVQILIADQCKTDFEYRIADLMLTEKNIQLALDEVELALSSYPKGFMEQLKYDGYTEIEIQLLGNIYEKDDGTLLGGFIEYPSGKFVMGLNITEAEMVGKATHQTFFHEISHIIEQKLAFESEYIKNGYSYDKWNTFNPKGFVYENENENRINMYWDYPEYFVDTYASTDQNEDRARIIEYASVGKWDIFEGKQPLKDKLSYYSQCIRNGFDTTGWPEKTIWENTPW